MEKKNLNNFITLIDDEKNEMVFEVLDFLKYNNREFYALTPNFEISDDFDGNEEKYFIFESKKSLEGESFLQELDDDKMLDELAAIFEERFKTIFS